MIDSSSRRTIALVVVAVALVISGCQAPGANTDLQSPSASNAAEGGTANTTSQTGTDDPFPVQPANITVDGGTLRTDSGLVYERLQVLLDTETPTPESIQVFNSTDELASSLPTGGLSAGQPRFFEVLGFGTDPITNETFVDQVGNGYTLGAGSIGLFVQPSVTRDEETMILAHEFVHYVQFQNDRQRQLAEQIDTQTVDGSYVVRALMEGPAAFTTDTYLERFGENETRNSPYYDREQAAIPPGHLRRWANSQYQAGSDYVTQRIDSPRNVSQIYENPPTRSRQLLDPDSPPAPSLTVSNTLDRDEISTNRLGTAFVRYALESHIDPDRARSVADGLGTDSLYQFRSDIETYGNYAWVTRWEQPAEAADFEAAFGEYLDERGNETADGWALDDLNLTVELRRPSAESVVALFGSDSFVTNTTARGSGGEIVIESRED
jgi:hypothetical protein